ncbi:hypothetical protein DL96DRAFT_1681555 [Flagelloscypha sp. PMI_526]|nr:hypothetical protein DL96DRAFT_1681555 [Flagelloscypha sp. PMI_526]
MLPTLETRHKPPSKPASSQAPKLGSKDFVVVWVLIGIVLFLFGLYLFFKLRSKCSGRNRNTNGSDNKTGKTDTTVNVDLEKGSHAPVKISWPQRLAKKANNNKARRVSDSDRALLLPSNPSETEIPWSESDSDSFLDKDLEVFVEKQVEVS